MQYPPTTISAAEFNKRMQAEPKPQIIDVRTAVEVENQPHEESAHFPLQELNCAAVKTYLAEQGHDPKQPVYLLCANGPRATLAAEQLQADLDCPLVIIEGGINKLNSAEISTQQDAGNTISLERQVRIASGALVLIGIILGSLLSPWLYAISAFVGGGLVVTGINGSCGLAMLLARMPWNKIGTQK
jgi:rhodanese-related sulfurtransferase